MFQKELSPKKNVRRRICQFFSGKKNEHGKIPVLARILLNRQPHFGTTQAARNAKPGRYQAFPAGHRTNDQVQVVPDDCGNDGQELIRCQKSVTAFSPGMSLGTVTGPPRLQKIPCRWGWEWARIGNQQRRCGHFEDYPERLSGRRYRWYHDKGDLVFCGTSGLIAGSGPGGPMVVSRSPNSPPVDYHDQSRIFLSYLVVAQTPFVIVVDSLFACVQESTSDRSFDFFHEWHSPSLTILLGSGGHAK